MGLEVALSAEVGLGPSNILVTCGFGTPTVVKNKPTNQQTDKNNPQTNERLINTPTNGQK